MAKQILIDEDLFTRLFYYHCLENQDNEEVNQFIKNALLTKMDKMIARKDYAEKLQQCEDDHFLDRK